MNFIWLFFAGVVVLILTTLVMSCLIKSFKRRFPDCDSVPFMSGITVLLSSLCIGLYFAWMTQLFFPILCLFLALCILQLTLLKFERTTRELLLFGVCYGTIFLIPTDGMFFKLLPVILGQLVLGGLCYLMVKLFSFMDRVNGYSLARLFGLGILFILFFHLQILPTVMQLPFFLFFMSLLAVIQTTKVFTGGYAVLGPFASVLVGFLVNVFICYIVSTGSFAFPIALYGLDITEIALATGMTVIASHRFYPLTTSLPVESAYDKGFETKKLNRFVFFILLSQSLLAFLFFRQTDITLLLPALFVLIFCTEYRFKNWDRPVPTYGSMFKDIKQGIIELKEQANYVPLKKNTKNKNKKKKQEKAKK